MSISTKKRSLVFILIFIFIGYFGENRINVAMQFYPTQYGNISYDTICNYTVICDLEWSPIDHNVLAVTTKNGLWIYNFADNQIESLFFELEYSTSLSFSPDGQSIGVIACNINRGDEDSCLGDLLLFDIVDQTWTEIVNYDFMVLNAKFSPDGNSIGMIQYKPNEYGLRLLNLETMQQETIVDIDRTNFINDFEFDNDLIAVSNGLPSGAFSKTSIWQRNTGELIAEASQTFSEEISFWNTSSTLAIVNISGEIILWQFENNIFTLLDSFDVPPDFLHNYQLIPSKSYILAATYQLGNLNTRDLILKDLPSQQVLFSIEMPQEMISTVEVDINSNYSQIAISSFFEECTILIFDVVSSDFVELCIGEQ